MRMVEEGIHNNTMSHTTPDFVVSTINNCNFSNLPDGIAPCIIYHIKAHTFIEVYFSINLTILDVTSYSMVITWKQTIKGIL